MQEWRFDVLGAIKNPVMELINKVDHTILPSKTTVWKPADAMLVAAYLYPKTIIITQRSFPASIELHGSQTRGQVVINHKNTTAANIMFIETIDQEAFKRLLVLSVETTQHTFQLKC